MSKEKYRAGIIGCGAISRLHARMYKDHERTELVSATDINLKAARRFSDDFSVSTYTDYKKMIDTEELDLVSVCTWHGTHAEQTIVAANKKVKGIICEKPMSINLHQADIMIKSCETNKTKLTVNHHFRYDPVSVEARLSIEKGVIGKPSFILSRTSEGLLNWGTHMIDHARYLLGDPETEWVMGQVERKTDRYERRVRIEDLCIGLTCFSGGIHFLLECDLPGPEMRNEPNTTYIYGSNGVLIPSCFKTGKVHYLNNDKVGWQEIIPTKGKDQLLSSHLEELIDWIEGRISDHRCSGRKARYTTEIMMAIYESLRTKGIVYIPMKTKENPLELMIKDGTLPVERDGKYDIRVPF
jgi:predicted dehydrogenase